MKSPSSKKPLESLVVAAKGLDFHVVAAGPVHGPLLLLLHGFPEFSYAWRHQIEPLAALGYRVVAPDQRGYGQSDKPFGAWSYRIELLADDVIEIAKALGHERFDLVGHDWGGIVAWRVASDFPAHVKRLSIINAPNLDIAFRHILKSPGQLLKSSYVAMFQLPLLPELTLSSMHFAFLAQALEASSLPGTFSDTDLARYRDAWSQRGALPAMLNWYRALSLTSPRIAKRITMPTLIIWGDRDSALDTSLAEDSLALCDEGIVSHVPDATHWVHHERPGEVNELLATFFGAAG